ncbi:unnamed protein product [Prorocentrum cordatum]|uniref:Uncharacterized protein n=1 Tax=Prorocentrum cordatum TaxID=2364126 RepID=A0ABN9S0N6_9DINO|nr:unnamed protein product [Polarella glacialis]
MTGVVFGLGAACTTGCIVALDVRRRRLRLQRKQPLDQASAAASAGPADGSCLAKLRRRRPAERPGPARESGEAALPGEGHAAAEADVGGEGTLPRPSAVTFAMHPGELVDHALGEGTSGPLSPDEEVLKQAAEQELTEACWANDVVRIEAACRRAEAAKVHHVRIQTARLKAQKAALSSSRVELPPVPT